ncbi:hypothetical protein [Dactylosporangium sp. NPDC049140]|uniref:RNA polymerase sigma factor n=1 Tax=Dactylosporangium sp. NPDC049140 TaxID=3155647 RepID=UPI0033FC19C4
MESSEGSFEDVANPLGSEPRGHRHWDAASGPRVGHAGDHIELEDIPALVQAGAEKGEVLWRRLENDRFQGIWYDMTEIALADYLAPTVSGVVATGRIAVLCRERGRPLKGFSAVRLGRDGIRDLVSSTIAHGLVRFRVLALAGSGWSCQRNAAMTTYAFELCVGEFPNIYNAWDRARAREPGPVVSLDAVRDTPYTDAAEERPGEVIQRLLPDTSDELAEIVDLRYGQGLDLGQIATRTERSPRAIEGLLYRLKGRLKEILPDRGARPQKRNHEQ